MLHPSAGSPALSLLHTVKSARCSLVLCPTTYFAQSLHGHIHNKAAKHASWIFWTRISPIYWNTLSLQCLAKHTSCCINAVLPSNELWSLTASLSVFVSSVIMYSSLPGVDVAHKLHWTPGETVSVCACVCMLCKRIDVLSSITATFRSVYVFFRATRLTLSAPCLNGLWPSPSSASSSPTSEIFRYSVFMLSYFTHRHERKSLFP